MSERPPTTAEQRAATEAAARARLDQGKQSLEALKARQLEEAEAEALARIRIQTDHMLAKQAEALRDAEQKAELAAISRRTADLEAAKEARRKAELEEAARLATAAKQAALTQAEAAAREKQAALELLAQKRALQKDELDALKSAASTDSSLRWKVRWLSFKLASPWKIGAACLLTGVATGLAVAYLELPHETQATPAFSVDGDTGVTPVLRLERELASR